MKSNTQNGALGLLAPVTGDRFARDIPNITTTKLEFTSVTTIDAILAPPSSIDDTRRSPSSASVWGRLHMTHLGRQTLCAIHGRAYHRIQHAFDSRLFISPILGVGGGAQLNGKHFSTDKNNDMMQLQHIVDRGALRIKVMVPSYLLLRAVQKTHTMAGWGPYTDYRFIWSKKYFSFSITKI